MRNLWHIDDSKRITPDKFLSCVEISKGSKCKYIYWDPEYAFRLQKIIQILLWERSEYYLNMLDSVLSSGTHGKTKKWRVPILCRNIQ